MKKANFIVTLLLCILASANMEAKKKPLDNGVYWELSKNGTLTISGNGDMPYLRTGKSPWFCSRNKIRKVIIEEGITSIGGCAFGGKIGKDKRYTFQDIVIANTVKRIDSWAFYKCTFSSVTLPESLELIEMSAFEKCEYLQSIVIPNKVTSIKGDAFQDCSELKEVQLPESLSVIPHGCFFNCKKLTDVHFPKQLTKIEKWAFYNTDLRKTILTFPLSLNSIGEEAFQYSNPKAIFLHNNIIEIGNNAFSISWDNKPYEGEINHLPPHINEKNCTEYGLSVKSVREYINGMQDAQGDLIVAAKEGRQIKRIGNTDSYIIKEGNQNGVINTQRKWIVPWGTYSDIEIIGDNYLKVKSNDFYGIFTFDGKEIIPISRNYTSIGNYNSNKRTFAFTKKGVKGICDINGKEISTTRLAPTADDIKESGNYSNAIAMTNGGKKYYKVNKNGHYGLTDAEGRMIVPIEMEALESTGTGYLKFKLNGFWGLMDYAGKIIIDTSRGYTSIGDFISFTKRFPYTMTGYKGECDLTGKEISRIKVATPQRSTASSSSSSSSSSSNGNSGNNPTKVVVEHHRDPVPVQEWQQCFACYGSGRCSYVKCGGSGWYYIGDRMSTCSMCHGSGKCTTCAGRGGQNVTVYR